MLDSKKLLIPIPWLVIPDSGAVIPVPTLLIPDPTYLVKWCTFSYTTGSRQTKWSEMCCLWKQHDVCRDLGRFPIRQVFRSNRLKRKWNARTKWKFPGTNGGPSELLHFFCYNQLERKLPFHLQKNSFSTAPVTNFLRHHSRIFDLPMRLQYFQTENFG